MELILKGINKMNLFGDKKAQALPEYALIISLASVIVISVLLSFGPLLNNIFQQLIISLQH